MYYNCERAACATHQAFFHASLWGYHHWYLFGRIPGAAAYQRDNILFGLITWGGSETINCKPGGGICRIETVLNFQLRGLTRDRSGQVGFEKIPVTPGREPVVVGVNDEGITFAVDLTQVPTTRLAGYASREFVLDREFILPPDIVRNLGLYKGSGLMGYVVPKGRYPLYRDGNIVYWTFNPKQALK